VRRAYEWLQALDVDAKATAVREYALLLCRDVLTTNERSQQVVDASDRPSQDSDLRATENSSFVGSRECLSILLSGESSDVGKVFRAMRAVGSRWWALGATSSSDGPDRRATELALRAVLADRVERRDLIGVAEVTGRWRG